MADRVIPWTKRIDNDEPIYEDRLGHHMYAAQMGERLLSCDPPYVLGILGAWGSGKASFLRKVWAYLGGESEHSLDDLRRWYGENWVKPKNLYLVWFNPWHHQFESSPMVALLQEIRTSFARLDKFKEEAKKLADVTVYSAVSVLGELISSLSKLDPAKIVERGREYEAERLLTPLSSQRFRELFRAAVRQVIKKDGRLVVFIDDLDRCEGDTAYRLLEALKLYLNAENCVYVLGLDQKHLEETIARVFSGKEQPWRFRPLAREYLGKMFQCQFLLPVTPEVTRFIEQTLNFQASAELLNLLKNRFQLKSDTGLFADLNGCLPHNPRKIKAFIASWRLYLNLLTEQKAIVTFDWRLTVVLNYLAQFEEPIYRKVEEAPGFFQDEVLRFCKSGEVSPQFRPLFDGLELPYKGPTPSSVTSSGIPGGPLGSESFTAPPVALGSKAAPDGLQPSPAARVFWIRNLVLQIESDALTLLGPTGVGEHLLRAHPA